MKQALLTTRLRLLPDATAYRLYRRADPNSDALYIGQLAYQLDGELPALWFSDLPAEEADAVEALGAALDALFTQTNAQAVQGEALALFNQRIMTREDWEALRAGQGCPGPLRPFYELPLMLVAAAALINEAGRVLVTQRPSGKPYAGLWEFPGGKLEAGEPLALALIRELDEELGLRVQPNCLNPLSFATQSQEAQHLLLTLFTVRRWQGEARPREGQALQWLTPRELRRLPMPPANQRFIAALIEAL